MGAAVADVSLLFLAACAGSLQFAGGRTSLSERLQDTDGYFEDLVTERLIPVTDLCFKLST